MVGWLAGERQFLGKSSCRATSAPLTPNQYSMNIQLVFKKTFDPFFMNKIRFNKKKEKLMNRRKKNFSEIIELKSNNPKSPALQINRCNEKTNR